MGPVLDVQGGAKNSASLATSSPRTRLPSATVAAALAEQERRLISARTTAALKAKKAAGARLGNRTNLGEAQKLGAAANAQAAEAFAANVVPVVRSIQAVGVESLKGIADALNARGVRTPRGGSWHPQSVARLLARVS